MLVAVGDSVTAGQVLATMDAADLEAAVVQAKADLASAKEDLSQAQAAADASASASSSTSSDSSSGTSGASTGASPTTGSSTRPTDFSTGARESTAPTSAGPSASPSARPSGGSSNGPGSDVAHLLKVVQDAQKLLSERQASAATAVAGEGQACSALDGVHTHSGTDHYQPAVRRPEPDTQRHEVVDWQFDGSHHERDSQQER